MYRVVLGGASVGLSAYGLYRFKSNNEQKLYANGLHAAVTSDRDSYLKPLPTRSELISKLQDKETEFDVLVVGGGATGCGVALDSQTRGLKTALVEKYDYASGTSSRSTKLIHGGVRYLQNAIMKLDREQYHLVKEALHERANVLATAPHIASPLPILLPVYKWWQVPYFWAGIKMYDLVAGRQLLKTSYFLSRDKTIENFPMIKRDRLCGAIVYYDGQQDDARMNLTIAMSAIREGAACSNYIEVKNLLFKTENDERRVCGAHVRDMITGDEWDIKAKCVINATGPFTDSIRKMDNQDTPDICLPASGIHVVLPDYYCPKKYGLLDPATSDGRVIFFLPWQGKTIVGTTDRKSPITHNPMPSEEEIQFVLKETENYLNPDIKVRRGDVLSVWSGIRPLVLDPKSKDTKSVSRNHVTDVSETKLVTIAGGKWTTYRAMAKDAVDVAVKSLNLTSTKESETDGMLLEGASGWTPTYFIRLVQQFGMDPEVAEHLSKSYGVKAPQVIKLASMSGKKWPVIGKKIAEGYPFIEAEIIYSARNEYACTLVDMISRRIRLSFLDARTTEAVLPRVADLMGEELGWDNNKRQEEIKEAKIFLKTMGYENPVESVNEIRTIEPRDQEMFSSLFKQLDLPSPDEEITTPQIKKFFKTFGRQDISDEDALQIVQSVRGSNGSSIDQKSFLQMMVSIKNGNVTHNHLGVLLQKHFIADQVTRDVKEDL